MANGARGVVFCEDRGHEQFGRAICERVARETGLEIDLHFVSSEGGEGRALAELRAYQKAKRLGNSTALSPDLLVVLIDCNSTDWHDQRTAVDDSIDHRLFPHVVVGCPDPHIEAWYLADPQSFTTVVGAAPPHPEEVGGLDQGTLKRTLREAVRRGQGLVIGDGLDFAEELVDAMDLYGAGQLSPSLRHFCDDLRTEMTSMLRELD